MSINGLNGSNPHLDKFRSFDTDRDGKLDRNELEKTAADLSQRTGRNITADQLLKNGDQDGDGKLSPNEMPPPPRDPNMQAWSGESSYDGTSLDSMAQSLSKATGRPVDARGVLALFDTDGDGQVSQQEAGAGRNALPSDLRDRLDALRMQRT